ncbi:DUF1778 domain-containing protein [Bifidobacterium bifidum]|uniref:type II toxin -antitoxin system TacA 1-like antitoxin n=1 Tax=Bifidobacterium bifidum TaxID=1681 RepID=UPI003CFC0C06
MATLTKQTVSKQETSRLDIRLTDAQRQLIERAAELTGSTLRNGPLAISWNQPVRI